jgi:hypothetical protein
MQTSLFKNQSIYQTDAAKNTCSIEENFFAYDYIKKLPDSLSSRTRAVRRG